MASVHSSQEVKAFMNDIWDDVKSLEGLEIKTSRQARFRILLVTDTTCTIHIESSDKTRPIHRSEIEAVSTMQTGRLRPIDVRNSGASEYSPAYVAAVLNRIREMRSQD